MIFFEHLEFRIVGDGGWRKKIEAEIRKNNLQNIRLLGFQECPNEYLQKMDVFVLPSLKEGLPCVVLEAMMCGVLVVASRVGEFRK